MSRKRNTLFTQECMTDIHINRYRLFIDFFFEMLNVTLSNNQLIFLYNTFAETCSSKNSTVKITKYYKKYVNAVDKQ